MNSSSLQTCAFPSWLRLAFALALVPQLQLGCSSRKGSAASEPEPPATSFPAAGNNRPPPSGLASASASNPSATASSATGGSLSDAGARPTSTGRLINRDDAGPPQTPASNQANPPTPGSAGSSLDSGAPLQPSEDNPLALEPALPDADHSQVADEADELGNHNANISINLEQLTFQIASGEEVEDPAFEPVLRFASQDGVTALYSYFPWLYTGLSDEDSAALPLDEDLDVSVERPGARVTVRFRLTDDEITVKSLSVLALEL